MHTMRTTTAITACRYVMSCVINLCVMSICVTFAMCHYFACCVAMCSMSLCDIILCVVSLCCGLSCATSTNQSGGVTLKACKRNQMTDATEHFRHCQIVRDAAVA